MRRIFAIGLQLVAVMSFGQNREKVDLDWKLGIHEKLTYQTEMTEIDTSSVNLNFDLLSKSFSDSTDKSTSHVRDLFRKLRVPMVNSDLMTTLTNKGNGIIDIEAQIVKNQPDRTNERDSLHMVFEAFKRMMESMTQGVVLRGSVYESGQIHSFWIRNNQKNLIAILFELPTRAVHVGDTWELTVNFIANDQNFECDSSFRVNRVTMVDLKKVGNERVAVLKYEITEFVKGKLNLASFGGGDSREVDTMIKVAYQALAEFSVENGRWISYDGIMTLISSGVMSGNKRTKFSLKRL